MDKVIATLSLVPDSKHRLMSHDLHAAEVMLFRISRKYIAHFPNFAPHKYTDIVSTIVAILSDFPNFIAFLYTKYNGFNLTIPERELYFSEKDYINYFLEFIDPERPSSESLYFLECRIKNENSPYQLFKNQLKDSKVKLKDLRKKSVLELPEIETKETPKEYDLSDPVFKSVKNGITQVFVNYHEIVVDIYTKYEDCINKEGFGYSIEFRTSLIDQAKLIKFLNSSGNNKITKFLDIDYVRYVIDRVYSHDPDFMLY